MKKKCIMIYNPTSGRGFSQDMVNKYLEIMHEYSYDVTPIATQATGDATKIVASAEGYDMVFAIGGDGTINEVVNGNAMRKKPIILCPLPGGTCNDFATMMGYGRNLEKNLRMALDGSVKTLDIGTINSKHFIYVAGIGMFLNISYDTPKKDKKRLGYLAYIKYGIKEAFHPIKLYKSEIEIDKRKFQGDYSLILISNSNHIAGMGNFYKDVTLNDGVMEVLLFNARNIFSFAWNFILFKLGFTNKHIIRLLGKDIKVEFVEEERAVWGIDGEKCPLNSNLYDISLQDQMKFLIPNKNINKLFK